MHVVYTKRKTGFKPGLSYRHPRFFAGAEKAAKEVTIEGNFPEIAEAYRKLGIKVNMETPEETPQASEGDSDEETAEETTEEKTEEEQGEEVSEAPKRSRRRK